MNAEAGTVNDGSTQREARRLDLLPSVKVRTNWRDDKIKMGHLLIHGFGPRLDDVAEAFVAYVKQRTGRSTSVGFAAENEQLKGRTRTLRFVNRLRGMHVAAADATLYTQGRDLYVRFGSSPRTPIVYLRLLAYSGLFVLLFSVFYLAYFGLTDARSGLANAFASQYSMGDNKMIATMHYLKTMSLVDYFQKDPRVFIQYMGMPPAIIAVSVGILLRFLPKNWLHTPCRLIGWPTPDLFRTHVLTHNGEVEAAFGQMMGDVFGVYNNNGITVIQSA